MRISAGSPSTRKGHVEFENGVEAREVEWLHEVISTACRKGRFFIAAGIVPGDDDDWHPAELRTTANISYYTDAVEPWQFQIDKDQIGPILQSHVDRLHPIFGGDHVVAFQTQQRAHHFAAIQAVFSDQN